MSRHRHSTRWSSVRASELPEESQQCYEVHFPREVLRPRQRQDVEDWINQMDRFMRVAQLDESLQVGLAASSLTGPAYKAWASIENMRRHRKQEVALDFLYETLRTSYRQIFPEQRLRRKLKTLCQISTVEQYARIFLTTWGS